MSEKSKEDILRVISSNLNLIKNQKLYEEFLNNPWILSEYMYDYSLKIENKLVLLRQKLKDIEPFMKKLEISVYNITDQNAKTAIFLLLSSAFATFDSILILAIKWHYNPMMILLRNIEESLMQSNLFCTNYNDWKNTKIENWFTWKIIQHSDWRENFSKKMQDIDIDIKSLQSYIYQMTSTYAHNGYTSMVENINPYTKKIDFNWMMWSYRTIKWLDSVSWSINNFIIALKWLFVFVLKDYKSYDEIDKILFKYAPDLNDISKLDNIRKFFPKEKK